MRIEVIDGKMYPLTRETIERLLQENTQFKKGLKKLFFRRNVYKKRYLSQRNKCKKKDKLLSEIKDYCSIKNHTSINDNNEDNIYERGMDVVCENILEIIEKCENNV